MTEAEIPRWTLPGRKQFCIFARLSILVDKYCEIVGGVKSCTVMQTDCGAPKVKTVECCLQTKMDSW